MQRRKPAVRSLEARQTWDEAAVLRSSAWCQRVSRNGASTRVLKCTPLHPVSLALLRQTQQKQRTAPAAEEAALAAADAPALLAAEAAALAALPALLAAAAAAAAEPVPVCVQRARCHG